VQGIKPGKIAFRMRYVWAQQPPVLARKFANTSYANL